MYALVALSLITLLAGLLFPRWLHRVTDHLVPSPWTALLVGFVASLAVPVALLFVAVTIIGAPLALGALLVWTVMILLTFVYGAYYIGRLIFRDAQHPVVKALVGGVILIVALQIPWLNIIVWLAMVFFGLGAQLLELYRQRPWHIAEADAPGAAAAGSRPCRIAAGWRCHTAATARCDPAVTDTAAGAGVDRVETGTLDRHGVPDRDDASETSTSVTNRLRDSAEGDVPAIMTSQSLGPQTCGKHRSMASDNWLRSREIHPVRRASDGNSNCADRSEERL